MSLRAAAALATVAIAMVASPTSPSHAQSPPASTDDHFGTWFQTVGTREPEGYALYVGDLDGPVHHVLSADFVQGTGPSAGRVLVWWRDGTRWTV